MVIVCSKTFVTQETQANANAARELDRGGARREGRPAITSWRCRPIRQAMDAFGIAPEHRFTMWDWVGGRYSVWSAVGLDRRARHRQREIPRNSCTARARSTSTSRTAPFEQNLPVLMGMLGVWNRTLPELPTLAVLPYDERLARLPAYLQQLEMESNGKSVSLEGEHVDFATAPVVWGEPGSNAQHSFFQMLHQGTPDRGARFHCALRGSWGGTEGARSRPEELLRPIAGLCLRPHRRGSRGGNAQGRRRAPRRSTASASHRVHEGNRPSSLLLYPQTTARSLGGMLALYEHSVFVQGTIWGMNSFDQFGVELGKKLAAGISMKGDKPPTGPGAEGLAALIRYVQSRS